MTPEETLARELAAQFDPDDAKNEFREFRTQWLRVAAWVLAREAVTTRVAEAADKVEDDCVGIRGLMATRGWTDSVKAWDAMVAALGPYRAAKPATPSPPAARSDAPGRTP